MKHTLAKISAAVMAMLSAGYAVADAALPVVSSCTMQQGPGNRIVTIKYAFEDNTVPAVVTIDVKTNVTGRATANEADWVSIGGECIQNAQGAVWRKVTPDDLGGDGKFTITWDPTVSWKDGSGNGFRSQASRVDVTAWPLDNTPDYMLVDVSDGARPNTQTYYPAEDFVPGGVTNGLYKTTMLLLRKIMAKDVTFTMGSTPLETKRYSAVREATHQVTLTNNYYIGVYEVTQAQWSEIATNSGAKAFFSLDNRMRPMELVCYNEIRLAHSSTSGKNNTVSGTPAADPSPDSFLGLLRLKSGLDFDLPSEAQWELAARAGHGDGLWNDGSAIQNVDENDVNLGRLGRYMSNGGYFNGAAATASFGPTNGTAIVGSYAKNSWGLYDMHGNVNEWCLDWLETDIATAVDASGNPYGGRVNIDPSDPSRFLSGAATDANTQRVIRGGSWYNNASYCRSAFRSNKKPNSRDTIIGFRVVCTAGLK